MYDLCACLSSYQCWGTWHPPRRPGSSAPLSGWYQRPGLWRSATPPQPWEPPAPFWPWNPTSGCPRCSWSVSWKQERKEGAQWRSFIFSSEVQWVNHSLTLAGWSPGSLWWSQRSLPRSEVRRQILLLWEHQQHNDEDVENDVVRGIILHFQEHTSWKDCCH